MGAQVSCSMPVIRPSIVIPANAGTHGCGAAHGESQPVQPGPWVPACVGTTGVTW